MNDLVLCLSIIAKHSMNFPVLDLKSTGNVFEHVLRFTLEGDVRNVFGPVSLDIVRDATGDLFALIDVKEALLLVMLELQVETVGYV